MSPGLDRLLEASARRWPERTAVEDPERGSSVDYRGLDAAADAVASRLRAAGVGPGDRVGVYAPKSIATVASFFGVLRTGAGYVPVDPAAPVSRNAFILSDCAVRAAVVERRLSEKLLAAGDGPVRGRAELDELRGLGPDVVLLEMPEPAPRTADPSSDDVAYVLYTSGSTGTPKGVVHSHGSATSFVDWCSEAFQPTPDDRFSSHAPFHFDLSILDLYVPLKHGARVVLLGEELGKQPARLAEVLAQRGLTVWYSTPSILRLLVEFGGIERHDCSRLRWVLFAGEVFPPAQFRALRARWPHPRYANLYGPTETNVCTWYEVPPGSAPDEPSEPLPIGRACPNDRTRVVDEDGRDVPCGQEGELVVSGGSVMRGYWNRTDLTERAFLRDSDGVAWYRTGDIVVELTGGSYRFVGRRDRMVKRRGYRVELGEIEAALHRHPHVREAAVVALPGDDGVQVKAFVSLDEEGAPSVIELKRFCAENLPLYMVPDRFVFVDALPRTSTDKTDYQRLRERA